VTVYNSIRRRRIGGIHVAYYSMLQGAWPEIWFGKNLMGPQQGGVDAMDLKSRGVRTSEPGRKSMAIMLIVEARRSSELNDMHRYC